MNFKYSFQTTFGALVLTIVLFSKIALAASSSAGPKLPQLDITTYSSQIFWLLISFVVLYFLIAKFAMPRIAEVLEERQERIEADLDKAETLKKEAYQVRIEYEKALATARERAHAAALLAQEDIAKQSAEAEAAAQAKVTVMLEDAEKRIRTARSGAASSTETVINPIEQTVAREIVGDAVKKLIGVQVSSEDVETAISSTLKESAR